MDKELIEHIANKLKQHQAPYADGAWERFLAKDQKKRGFIYWPIWSAAAILLIASGLFLSLYKDNGNTPKPHLTKNSITNKPINNAGKNSQQNNLSIQQQNPKNQSLNLTVERTAVELSTALVVAKADTNPINQGILSGQKIETKIETVTAAVNPINIADSSHQIAATNATVEKRPEVNTIKKITFEDILARDSKNLEKTTVKKVEAKNKWQPGIYVGSAIGNDNKVKMNYGFSLSYQLADKISINSGIAYNALSATENTDANRPQSLSGRSLESVNASLKGINIPLEVKYSFTDKFYSGIGVSALAVLDNRQENSYLINRIQQVNTVSSTGVSQNKTLIVTQRTTEPVSNTNNQDKYIGFYNFSLGYKQKVTKKFNVSVEPFLRLPMKTFSNEGLNLTNGGLRLKFDF